MVIESANNTFFLRLVRKSSAKRKKLAKPLKKSNRKTLLSIYFWGLKIPADFLYLCQVSRSPAIQCNWSRFETILTLKLNSAASIMGFLKRRRRHRDACANKTTANLFIKFVIRPMRCPSDTLRLSAFCIHFLIQHQKIFLSENEISNKILLSISFILS